jgi:hypothetical protein
VGRLRRVDPDGIYGDRAYNFKGKPDRPGTVCAKCKPEYEDDFVVFFDPENGFGTYSQKERYGKGIYSAPALPVQLEGRAGLHLLCGGGLSEEQKREWADPSLYPMVWKVEYSDRRYRSAGDKTDALDHPRFIARRTDKKPDECVNPLLDLPEVA